MTSVITLEEYEDKKSTIENAYFDDVKRLEKKYNVENLSEVVRRESRKDDPENVKKARAECKDCGSKARVEIDDLKSKFAEEYNKLVEDSKKFQESKGNQNNKGDKKMEPKDEKELENVVTRLLEKQNKNSKFESTINDIHTKISKIDSIEKGLVDIIPKVQKIDSICEDGKCFKTELADIKKDLAETKKGKISAEICTDCGEKAVIHSDTFLASHCANCGAEVPEWNDDEGKPVTGWKNYKLRGK